MALSSPERWEGGNGWTFQVRDLHGQGFGGVSQAVLSAVVYAANVISDKRYKESVARFSHARLNSVLETRGSPGRAVSRGRAGSALGRWREWPGVRRLESGRPRARVGPGAEEGTRAETSSVSRIPRDQTGHHLLLPAHV